MRMSETSLGRVHSFQSLGTLDGPGVRFVVFLQGCNLRCSCCHNPDTWAIDGGTLYTVEQVVTKAERFSSYFGEKGGITLSGGEPLLQAEFASGIFSLCKDKGINTCLDTSGSVLSPSVKKLLDLTDRILLDIKYVEDEKYRKYVGCSIDKVVEFLDLANEKGIPTTLRQVIIPTVNDTDREIEELVKLAQKYPCVDGIELLPFRKICQVKYDELGIDFPFSQKEAPGEKSMDSLRKTVEKYYR